MRTKPPIEIDLQEVQRLSGLGLTKAEIALSLGISEGTLYARQRESKEFEEAIKRGQANAATEVSNALYNNCKKGDITSIIWYEKTRRGLSDKINVKVDVSQLSDDELQSIIES